MKPETDNKTWKPSLWQNSNIYHLILELPVLLFCRKSYAFKWFPLVRSETKNIHIYHCRNGCPSVGGINKIRINFPTFYYYIIIIGNFVEANITG